MTASVMSTTDGPRGPVFEPYNFQGPSPGAHPCASNELAPINRYASESPNGPAPVHSVQAAPLMFDSRAEMPRLERSLGQHQLDYAFSNVFSTVQSLPNETRHHDFLSLLPPHAPTSSYVFGPTRPNRSKATVSASMDAHEASWQGIEDSAGSHHTLLVSETYPTNFPNGNVAASTPSSTGVELPPRGYSSLDPSSPAGPAAPKILAPGGQGNPTGLGVGQGNSRTDF